MLVLVRRPGEEIELWNAQGLSIRVTYLGVDHSGRARFGIDADRSINIDRAEVAASKRRAIIAARGDANGNTMQEIGEFMRRGAAAQRDVNVVIGDAVRKIRK